VKNSALAAFEVEDGPANGTALVVGMDMLWLSCMAICARMNTVVTAGSSESPFCASIMNAPHRG